jgi:hypothetical protein
MILKSTLGPETNNEASVTNRVEQYDDNVAKKVRILIVFLNVSY